MGLDAILSAGISLELCKAVGIRRVDKEGS